MGGGSGGGSTQIDPRQPSQEKKTIGNWYDFQQNQYGNYLANNPLLSTAQTGALANYGSLSGLLSPLAALQAQAPGFYSNLQGALGGYRGDLGQYSGQLGALSDRLGGILNRLPGVGALTAPLQGTLGSLTQDFNRQIQPVIAGGGYSPEIDRLAAQRSRLASEAAGTAHTLGGIGREVLTRQDVQDQRLQNYLGMGQNIAAAQGGLAQGIQGLRSSDVGLRSGLLGQIGQLTGARAGLTGQQAGIAGQQGGLFGQQSALANLLSSGQQGLQTGALGQLLNVGNAGVGQFGALTNPILGYLGNLFSNNLQAQVAQAGINQQGNVAGQNKQSSGIGSILSTVGPIIGAVASDERLKKKIRGTGLRTPEGVPLKTWEYKTRPGVRFLGPTAQDVEKKLPARVITEPKSGLKAIVGFPVIEVSPIKRKA